MTSNTNKRFLVSIVGPTAVGKTALGIRLANKLKTEIISADSRQFYREMTIGTAKPSSQGLLQAKHHFIDCRSIEEEYNAGQFGRDARQLMARLFKERRTLVAVGGSGLYLRSLWEGLDEMPVIGGDIRRALNEIFDKHGLSPLIEELKEKDPHYYDQVDQNNGQRIIRALEVIHSTGQTFSSFRKSVGREMPYENIKIGINMERERLFEHIDLRMDLMIGEGLFEEAEKLYPYRSHNALQTVGYSEIFGFMDGEYDKDEAIRLLKRNSRRYAKRQMTWFRKYRDIYWFEPDDDERVFAHIASLIK